MSTIQHSKPDVSRAFKLRQRMSLDRIDYAREVVSLTASLSQVELSRELHITQPTISATVKQAAKIAPVQPGFSGGTPYEIAQRFAVGEITKEQVVDELSRWAYAPQGQTDGYDSLLVDPSGTFPEVVKAADDGLIDNETYDAILDRSEAIAHSCA